MNYKYTNMNLYITYTYDFKYSRGSCYLLTILSCTLLTSIQVLTILRIIIIRNIVSTTSLDYCDNNNLRINIIMK